MIIAQVFWLLNSTELETHLITISNTIIMRIIINPPIRPA